MKSWAAGSMKVMLMLVFAPELRIHDYTERGDNDTIKKGGKGMGAAFMGECCGGKALLPDSIG